MEFVADFHIHSKFSRATSGRCDLENLEKACQVKGVKVLSTGDFTHPAWFSILREKLEPAEAGLFKLKNSLSSARFILTTEISCIYSKNGRVRKIHVNIFAPSFKVVEAINAALSKIGNLKADGRPILGLDAKELLKITLEASEDCLFVPSHCWTPWFALFGSKSGFDSVEECFEDLSGYIYALETGLSSDPPMNWRLSALDKITLISNSDAHSPEKIAREANVFDADLSYFEMIEAIKKKDRKRFLHTIEFFPEEGKYHYDGHRLCNVSLSPQETKKYSGICPVCGKPLTVGVLNRVEELADRPAGFVPQNAISYKSLVPLKEIIAEVLGIGENTGAVEKRYRKLIEVFENELNILIKASEKEIENASLPEIAEAIMKAREGKVFVKPGYDGVYGKISIFQKNEGGKPASKQETLF